MFRPAQMVQIDMRISEEHFAKITKTIGELKILHVLNIRKNRVGEKDLEAQADKALLQRYRDLKSRLEKIFQSLGLQPGDLTDAGFQEGVHPHLDIPKLTQEIQEIQDKISPFISQINTMGKIRGERQKLAEQWEILSKIGVDITPLGNCRYLYVAMGLIPIDNIERLSFSLSNIYHLLIPSSIIDKQRLLFVFSSPKDREKIDRALRSAYFEFVIIPQKEDCNLAEEVEGLQHQIKQLDQEMTKVVDQLEKLESTTFKERLQQLNQKVTWAIKLLEIGQSYDKVGQEYHISGWIPQAELPALEKNIKEATNQQVKISVVSSINTTTQGGDFSKIPTCLRNPSLVRPFEKLISGYGIPSYLEIDPTFLFALSFVLMFGVMFGDVGHGAVLILIGWLVVKKSTNLGSRDIGLIAIECGFMSTIFGFLYGSVFGFEHLLPALWFHPVKNILYFMQVAVGFGIVMLSLAFIFNIINSIKHHDFEKGLVGEYGLSGLVFYWGCIGLVFLYKRTGGPLINPGYFLPILLLPLLIIFFKEPISNLYRKRFLKKELAVMPKNIGLYLIESFIETGDAVIGFLANTVSFIRIPAFALAHAGLFLAVFSLANTLQRLKGGILWYWLIMIIGNIGIIVIEGAVVSIQIIRLEYYELFSKFFKGGGETYKPLKI